MGLIYVPNEMPEVEKQKAQIVVDNIYWLLMHPNTFNVLYRVPRGESCQEAAYARGDFVAQYIPENWWIDCYCWRSGFHIANMMYFRSRDGFYYCWSVDGYAPPVTQDNVTWAAKTKEIPSCAGKYLEGTNFYKYNDSNLVRGKGFKHHNPLAIHRTEI